MTDMCNTKYYILKRLSLIRGKSNMATIKNLRKTVSEYKNVPKGFHVEVWSCQNYKGEIELWTSEYLTQNSWTEYRQNPEFKRLDGMISQIWEEDLYDGVKRSLTDTIRLAVERKWRV